MKTASVTTVLVVLAFALVLSEAQTDLSRVLVGKWEGEIERPQVTRPKGGKQAGGAVERRENTRFLILEKIHEQGGRWVVDKASFGQEGKTPKPVEVSLQVSGGEVSVEFETEAGAKVKLRLSGDNVLSGTWVQTQKFQKLEMKKVE
jgi:hypothetical protein